MRIAVGIMFWSHGAQKLLGWFGSDPVELASRFGIAGILEFVGGLLIVLGLFTRPVAFILAGEMAVAYFWIHVGNNGLWWWANRGELAAVYAFVFLAISAFGAGPYSLDAVLATRRAAGGGSGGAPAA
jgi:putative oxidoreductase